MRVNILHTCRKHLYDPIISLKREVWFQKTSFTPWCFIEVPVPSQESVIEVVFFFASFSTIFMDFGTVLMMWYFLCLFIYCNVLFSIFFRELRDPQFLPERLSAKAAKDIFEKFQKIEKDYNHQFSGETWLFYYKYRTLVSSVFK